MKTVGMTRVFILGVSGVTTEIARTRRIIEIMEAEKMRGGDRIMLMDVSAKGVLTLDDNAAVGQMIEVISRFPMVDMQPVLAAKDQRRDFLDRLNHYGNKGKKRRG